MRVALTGGAYQARSVIANAQRCINLFPEKNPSEDSPPIPVTHYQRPGLTLLNPAPMPGSGRCLYRASNGDLYAIVDTNVYYIDPDWTWHFIGQLINIATTPAYMADNGTDILIVDGSVNGFQIRMADRNFSQVADPNFLGANRISFIDSFLVMNQPATPNFYSTLSNQIAFDALDVGTKSSYPDNIVSIICCHRLIWLLGSLKGEVWFNAGTPGFSLQSAPGVIVEHGCVAPYSVATQDVSLFWLSQSPEGDKMVMEGATDYSATRISTHAIEAEFRSYPKVDDAIGAVYQQDGHAFYKLHFPTADKTWVYDKATKQWHERAWTDSNGVLHRERDSFNAFAYGVNVGLDWNNGNLYALDQSNFTDQLLALGNIPDAGPITFVRSMPHLVQDKFQRISYKQLIADIQVGTGAGTTDIPIITSPWSSAFSNAFGPIFTRNPPTIRLRMSDDRGVSYGNFIEQPLGAAGHYEQVPTWWRLGMARDRVFELRWSSPQAAALNGVFVELEAHET